MNDKLTMKQISAKGRKYINKRIDYVQAALKKDDYESRPLKDFSELVFLIGDQFDNMLKTSINK